MTGVTYTIYQVNSRTDRVVSGPPTGEDTAWSEFSHAQAEADRLNAEELENSAFEWRVGVIVAAS